MRFHAIPDADHRWTVERFCLGFWRSLRLGLQFSPTVLASDRKPDAAFRSLAQIGVGGVVVQPIFTLDPEIRATVVNLSLQYRLPAVSGLRRFADAGGRVAYASEFSDLPKRVAIHVDKILKGATPSELPVEQPTHFQLVFNLKTAKTLGVAIPQHLLLRADHLVE